MKPLIFFIYLSYLYISSVLINEGGKNELRCLVVTMAKDVVPNYLLLLSFQI